MIWINSFMIVKDNCTCNRLPHSLYTMSQVSSSLLWVRYWWYNIQATYGQQYSTFIAIDVFQYILCSCTIIIQAWKTGTHTQFWLHKNYYYCIYAMHQLYIDIRTTAKYARRFCIWRGFDMNETATKVSVTWIFLISLSDFWRYFAAVH